MRLLLILPFFLSSILSFSQSDFIQIETNKVTGVLSFLEAATAQEGTSSSYRKYIHEQLGKDSSFNGLLNTYATINLHYTFIRQELPSNRHSYRSTKDLIWVAATNSSSIDDFDQRIIGYLPHSSQIRLIKTLKEIEPYYDELVWSKEQAGIARIEKQLANYKEQIAELFLQINDFYGTQWNTQIPFKISLYPIPLEKGNTTAVPMGNALICGFLSKNENDYIGRLGVIIHEMCHILFDEQNADLQHQIDGWFKQSESDYSKLASSYLNEGLATAIGNGWAYQQLHKEVDTTEWYNNEYINGFAHSIFELTSSYLNQKKSIDNHFIEQSILAFEKTFPQAINETQILLNELQLYANSGEDEAINLIIQTMDRYFNIRSRWFSTPIDHPKSVQGYGNPEITKFFIIEKDHEKSIALIDQHFPDYQLKMNKNSIASFKDSNSKSPVFIINIENLDKLDEALALLAKTRYIEFGKTIPINNE